MSKILVDDRGRNEKSVCDYHRIHLPYLRGDQFESKSDLYIFNGLPTHGRASIESLRARGFKIVMDLDDSLLVPEGHMLAPLFDSGLREELIWMMRNADAMLTTTENLAEEFSQYNKNVHVVPNGLPFDEEGFTITQDRHSKSPFVWAGSETHKADLMVLPDLGNKLTICGYKTEAAEPMSKEEWRIISEEIAPNAIYEHHRYIDHYMAAYDGHEIALAPLADNKFNTCKSNLKILEAGAKGLPIICSKNDSYISPLLDGYVAYADGTEGFSHWAKMFYEHSDLSKELGLGLAEQVRKHFNISQMNDIRREIFRSL